MAKKLLQVNSSLLGGGAAFSARHAASSLKSQSFLAKASSRLERIWHIYESQGRILAVASRHTSLKPFQSFPLRSETATSISAQATESSLKRQSFLAEASGALGLGFAQDPYGLP